MITDEKIKSRTLQQIELDLGVETLNLIGESSFSLCTSLKEIIIQNGLYLLGINAPEKM